MKQLTSQVKNAIRLYPTLAPFKNVKLIHDTLYESVDSNNLEDKLDLLFYKKNCSELIDFSRNKNFYMANYIKSYMENHQISTSDLSTRYGIQQMKYSAIAYYFYSNKEFEKSLSHLNYCIEAIDELTNLGFKASMLAKIEQTLNLFRLFYERKMQSESLMHAYNVLNYLITDKTNEWFSKSWLNETASVEERIVITHTIFHNIFIKLILNNDKYRIESLLNVLSLNKEIIREEFKEIHVVIMAIVNFKCTEKEIITETITNNIIFFHSIPYCLQKILMDKITYYFEKINLDTTELKTVLNEYYRLRNLPNINNIIFKNAVYSYNLNSNISL